MKRLRAPEHQNTDPAAPASAGASNPAGGGQENLQAPAEASTAPAGTTAPENNTAIPSAASAEAQVPAATANPPAEPAQPASAAEQAEANPSSRCNGEATASPPSATHANDEQNG